MSEFLNESSSSSSSLSSSSSTSSLSSASISNAVKEITSINPQLLTRPFRTNVNVEEMTTEDLYQLLVNFNTDQAYVETIQHPKGGDMFIHYSTDEKKLSN